MKNNKHNCLGYFLLVVICVLGIVLIMINSDNYNKKYNSNYNNYNYYNQD